MHHRRFFARAGFLLIGLIAAAELPAQTFVKIADTATAVPGGSGNFTTFNGGNAIDAAGNVAFMALSSGNEGVYYSSGGSLSRVADLTTPIPSGTGNFTFFNSTVSTAGGNVAFNASGASSQSGIYHHNGSSTVRWADTNTAIPGGTGAFGGGVRAPYLHGSQIAFIGQSSGFTQQGVYVTDGTTTTRIADKTTAIPGLSGSYGWSSQLAFDSGNLAFAANNVQPGAFNVLGGYSSGGGLVTLASTSTAAPGAGANFTHFESPPDISGSMVFFEGFFSAGSGLYTTEVTGGAITRIADTSMSAPGGSGNFSSFEGGAISGGQLAFIGSYSGGSALFLHDGNSISRLIGTGDMLDGKMITGLGFGEQGLNGSHLVFRASFSGSSGIFATQLTAIPEPATWAALAGGLGLALAVWRRRSARQSA